MSDYASRAGDQEWCAALSEVSYGWNPYKTPEPSFPISLIRVVDLRLGVVTAQDSGDSGLPGNLQKDG